MSEKTWGSQQVSSMTGLTNKALEHYDKIGLVVPLKRNTGRRLYREYTREHIRKLFLVRLYQQLGYTLQEIKDIFEDQLFDIGKSLREVKASLEKKILTTKSQIATIDYLIKRVSGSNDFEKEARKLLFKYPEHRWILQIEGLPTSPSILDYATNYLEKGEELKSGVADAVDEAYAQYVETGIELTEDEVQSLLAQRVDEVLSSDPTVSESQVVISNLLLAMIVAKINGAAPDSDEIQDTLRDALRDLEAAGSDDPGADLFQMAYMFQLGLRQEEGRDIREMMELWDIDLDIDELSAFIASSVVTVLRDRIEVIEKDD